MTTNKKVISISFIPLNGANYLKTGVVPEAVQVTMRKREEKSTG